MKKLVGCRLVFFFLICGGFTYLLVPPIFSTHKYGDIEPVSNDAGLAEVKPQLQTLGRSITDYRPIWERNIFANDQSEAQAKETPVTEIPIANTNLGLRLVGTVVIENSGKSLAMIAHEDSGVQETCREGSRLDRVLVKRILQERVIIDDGGGEMILSMNDPLRGIAKGDVKVAKDSPAPGKVSASAYPARLDRKDVVKGYPDYLSLMKTARIKTQFREGSPRGILIDNIDPYSLFGRIGLQDGDVIKEVNGEPLASSADAVKIYGRLKHGGRVNIEIQRGKESMRLRLYVG